MCVYRRGAASPAASPSVTCEDGVSRPDMFGLPRPLTLADTCNTIICAIIQQLCMIMLI